MAKWTQEEEDFLKEKYLEGATEEKVTKLINEKFSTTRTQNSIGIKVKRLKLRHTEEQIRDNKSEANKGVKNSMFGKESWCRGLTKETSNILKIRGIETSIRMKDLHKEGKLRDISGENNPMFGKSSWSKGLTKETSEVIKNIGKKSSAYQKAKWENASEEERANILKKLNSANKKKGETKIEKKVREFLSNLPHEFISQYSIENFVADFYLPEFNLIIECQGDYWHANPRRYKEEDYNLTQINNIERDRRKENYYINNNFNYLFIWEYDINKNFESTKEIIRKKLAQYQINHYICRVEN